MRDLFPDSIHKGRQRAKRIVATYGYADAKGELLFEVVRYDPKGFAQRRPDGKGGWLWSLEGVPRVLYKLTEVLQAIETGQRIFITEGEKDADNLENLGFCATTNPGGAGQWRDEYSKVLRGAKIVIISDADEPGRKHAEQVAQSLQGQAMSVQVVELPGLGKDVSDWIAAGSTSADLEMLLTQTPEWEPSEPEDVDPPDHHLRDTIGTDLTNAERFAALHGDRARYVPSWGWLTWDGRHWRRDVTEEICRLTIETVKEIYSEAAKADNSSRRQALADWAKRSESRQRLEAIISLGGPLCAAHPDQFDTDPWLFNLLNGTLDLRTGELLEHRLNDFITKLALVEYDPEALAPTWDAFLNRIFAGNQNLICFVQKALGYGLTGDTGEQCLFILWGAGANGKSTLVNAIHAILGDYALATPPETLLSKRQDCIPNDVARLRGARFVTAIESAEGRRLNEPLIKAFAGGDRIIARFLHREYFEFLPTFKIFIATNHKPVIRGTDHAIWRRIRLIPFTETIPEEEQDRSLPQRLIAEAPGILNWLIKGCLAWQQEGLGMPDEVKMATESYRSEMDTMAAFFADRCMISEVMKVKSSDLYGAYRAWAVENTEPVLSQRAFGMNLNQRRFTRVRGTGGPIVWVGIGLRVKDGVNEGENDDQISENSLESERL
jgi:putative DNA primase/helicase